MLAWTLASLGLLLALRELLLAWDDVLGRARSSGANPVELARVSAVLHELQETLEAGLLPEAERWERLRGLPRPWGRLAGESLLELRSRGGALLPTIRRLRGLAEAQIADLKEARARSSQALAQAFVCAGMVPLFGGTLYFLLPGVQGRTWSWAAGCGLAFALAGSGALWMLRIADHARWAGLPSSRRGWALASQCAGERLLALIRGGTPADLAWARANELLLAEAPALAVAWGASVWASSTEGERPSDAASRMIVDAGSALRRSIQASLMEGRPCLERVEGGLQSLRQDFRSGVERELQLLAPRALQPLFVCVAPSLMGLLFFGMYLAWKELA